MSNETLSADVFKGVYQRYSAMVYSFLLKRCQDQELAMDVTQEAFCRAWQNRKKYNQDYQVDTWIIGIALNVLKERYRNIKKRNKEVHSEHMDRIADAQEPEAFSDDELLSVLQMAVETLEEKYRRAFELVRFDKKTYSQAAEIEGITRDALAQRVRRATLTLEKKITLWKKQNFLSLSSSNGQ